MGIEQLTESLKALASSRARSETARLRDIFNEIETALSAGVSRAAVFNTLLEQGFKMTFKSFESALYRIRKKQSSHAKTGNSLNGKMMKIAGFEVTSPSRFMHNPKPDNDLLT